MESTTFLDHRHCTRKLIIMVDLPNREIRFKLRHIPSEYPSQPIHDVDEFIAKSFDVQVTVHRLIKDSIEYAKNLEQIGYSIVEIHLIKGNTPFHLEHAKKALYMKGWHSIDETGLNFINRCENNKENENDNTSD